MTVRVKYSSLEKGKGINEVLTFEWDGKPTAKILPQYIAWMHTVLSQVAQRINKKILYAFPATDGRRFQYFGYHPDGRHERLPTRDQ